jgi:hypothetical protein
MIGIWHARMACVCVLILGFIDTIFMRRASIRASRCFAIWLSATIFLFGAFPLAISCAQTAAQIAPQWNTTANLLAEKIAAAAGAPGPLTVSMTNLSSLSAPDASGIYDALLAALRARRFQVASASSGAASGARVQVTFSEDATRYIWVAQIWTAPGTDAQVAMVTATRPAKSAARAGEVVLDAKLVWQQPTQILDFALPTSDGNSQDVLAVLEPQQLAFYSRTLAQEWQFMRALDAPPGHASRDWRGHIDLSRGSNGGDARSLNNECTGDFMRPATIVCSGNGRNSDSWISGGIQPPIKLTAGGDAVALGSQCDGNQVLVFTGAGDWTQPDTIQAQEIVAQQSQAAFVNSGNPISTDGPVMAIWPGNTPGTARAVVHNLQNGNYEAYVVTATCSQ